MLATIRTGRAEARDRAWLARGEPTGSELPGSRAAGKRIEQVVIDLDATLVTAHSVKEGAKGFKGGSVHHPLGAWLDNTNEAFAALLRPGNAGSNTAADHPTVVDLALSQLPDRRRSKPILIRADGAGYSHALMCVSQQAWSSRSPTPSPKPSVTPSGWSRNGRGRSRATPAGTCVSPPTSWRSPACSTCPAGTKDCPGMRVAVRHELPHHGATLDVFEIRDGYRYQAITTNTARGCC